MKMKNILGKGIALLLVVVMLLGVMIAVAENDGTGASEEQAEIPWEDYTRITLADYGVEASTDEAGTPYSSSKSGTYKGESLHKTYLDVDINLNGATNYFHHFGSADWSNNIRIVPYDSGFSIKDTAGRYTTAPWLSHKDFETSLNGFFNLKILTDIVTNATDETKDDVTVQFYFNEKLGGTLTWTETKGQNHNNFYFYCASGTYALRTPVIEEEVVNPLDGYTRITMEDFGVDASTSQAGTVYTSSKSGKYTGESLHKTYLDVDINFNETFNGANYLQYFGYNNWDDSIRFTPYQPTTAMNIQDTRTVNRSDDVWVTKAAGGFTTGNEFINVKVLTDIVANADDGTKNDVTLQFYLNDNYVGAMNWTEDANVEHRYFYFYCTTGTYSLRTPSEDMIETENCYQISEFRSAMPYTYPSKEGYVFAGWYADEDYTTSISSSMVAGYAYAKFVNEDVLTVKYQLPSEAERASETTDLRLITSVDSLNYQQLGFKLEYLSESETIIKEFTTKKVYQSFKENADGTEATCLPTIFSEASAYIATMKIMNVPSEVYEITMQVTPEWVTLDGTVVSGVTRDVVLFQPAMTGGETFANDNEAFYSDAWN